MLTKKCILTVFALMVIISGCLLSEDLGGLTPKGTIVADHTIVTMIRDDEVPTSAIQNAIANLHIIYGHTSHGSQMVDNRSGLIAFKGSNLFDFNTGGIGGVLDLRDDTPNGDLGNPDRVTWAQRTRDYLSDHPGEINVVMWSWCGQANGSEENINTYLNLMQGLEDDYPDIAFIYMTGHANGSGETGNLHIRNQQIIDFCVSNNKILYNFYNIDCHDPDGNYYGDKLVNDNCDYDSDGNGSLDSNWAEEWVSDPAHNDLWFNSSAAHTHALNGNLKAFTMWWLFARIAGWDGTPAD
jgi:hypothetical protein